MSRPLESTDLNPAADPSDEAVRRYMTEGTGADEEGFTGRPGDGEDEAEAPEAAQPREFKYRGKAVKVDADTYELLESLKKEARGANGRLGSELAQYREKLARLEGMVTARQPDPTDDVPAIQPPDPLLATRDIAAYQRDLLAYHAAREVQLQEKLERKYMATINEAKAINESKAKEVAWADDFYRAYDHLDDKALKPVVAQVYAENQEEILLLRQTDSEAAQERLAELTDARLLRVAEGVSGRGNTNTKSNRPPRVESSAAATPRGKGDAPGRQFSAARWQAEQRLKMTGRAVK